MSRIKDENYFLISGWMINHLQLKGNELIVFAIIYGFSQEDNQQYVGSRKYLADFAGCSVGTIDNCLASLVNKGLLIKNENITNGVKFCTYHTNYTPTTKFIAPTPKIIVPHPKICSTPTPNFVHNNNINNIEDNKLNNKKNNIKKENFTTEEQNKIQETCLIVKQKYPRCNYPILADRATVTAIKRIAEDKNIDLIKASEYLQGRIKLFAECKYGEDTKYLPEANKWLDNGGYDADENSWTKGTGNGNEKRYIPKNF